MQFRTDFNIPPFDTKISYKSQLLTIGSCFSALIGNLLIDRKFLVLNNPFGTVFNPLSVFSLLTKSLQTEALDEQLFVNYQNVFLHHELHSCVYARSQEELNLTYQKRIDRVKKQVAGASHLILTFGTAFIYVLAKNNKIVANCHKEPAAKFKKKRLTIEEMLAGFDRFYKILHKINPSVQIILTVSPVRHIKDGIPENQLSKSILRIFCQELLEKYPQVSYFPSYEIMMDDLRDYRFYKNDLIHPTQFAEEYIWRIFQEVYFDSETLDQVKKIESLLKALEHKPFQPESPAYRQFLENLIQKMERMQPEFDFSKELSFLREKTNRLFRKQEG